MKPQHLHLNQKLASSRRDYFKLEPVSHKDVVAQLKARVESTTTEATIEETDMMIRHCKTGLEVKKIAGGLFTPLSSTSVMT